jgi:signal transduction histidine kinase/CheY-like chemotaxis protein
VTEHHDFPTPDVVLNALAEPVIVTDADGVITFVNPAAARHLEADKYVHAASATHLTAVGARHPDGVPFLVGEYPVQATLGTRTPTLNVPMILEQRAGGRRLWLASTTPLWNGDRLGGTVSTYRESAGVGAVPEGLDHVALLDATLNLVSDAIFVVNAEGVVVFANAVGTRVLGITQGMTAAERVELQALCLLADRDGVPLTPAGLPSARALRGEAVSGEVLLLNTMRGERREMLHNAHPLRGPEGRIYGALVTAKDVTDEARTRAEIESARESAESANRLKDEFIAALSHELRAPLQPILGWTEVLRRHGTLDAVTAKALEAIRRNIRQQVRLVDDLLDLSRIVHHKLTLHYETFDLRDQIRAAAEPYEEAAALKRVGLTVDVPAEAVTMWGDGARIQQVATNLISNAVKYTPTGGQVAVRVVAADAYAMIEVEDTGEGIASEDLTMIFDAFQQGYGAARRGGLGIGLNLVRRLTELHGGTVDVYSEGVGYGARFRVTLPRVRQRTQPAVAVAASGPRLRRRSILIIEDNDDTRDVMKFMLEAEGARVVTAATGAEGVAAAKEHRPQVVLCDIGLPDIDGIEVARRLRRHAGLAGTRLISLTGYGQPEDVRSALEAGFEAHLTKPINLDQLLDLLGAPADEGTPERKDSRWTS